MIKRIVKIIFPKGSRGFIVLRRLAIMLRLIPALPLHELQYSEWASRVEPLNWSAHTNLSYQPLVSIIVPVFNPPAMHFLPMVYSVINQTYDKWQLVLVNASSELKSRTLTERAALMDKRIKIVNVTKNMGIAGNTNAGIDQADGEYIGLLDHDDTLAPQALYEIARMLQGKERPQLIYSDEDKLTNKGDYRVDPHLKPSWSPQLLRGLNYINHFTVADKQLLLKEGGYRIGFDGAQDYDLFLRLTDRTNRIAHVPKILYHWRTARTSTAENFSQKKNVLDAGIKALQDHLERNGQRGQVSAIEDQPGFYKIDYDLKDDDKIAILVLPSPLHGEYRKFLFNLLGDLKKTKLAVEVFVQNLKVPLKNIPPNINLHYINESDREFFIKKASESIKSDFTLVVGCGIFPIGKKWLKSLAGLISQVKSIAIAMPFIMSGDKETIIDAGYVKAGDANLPLFQGYPDDQHTPLGNSNWARNVDAVSSRCFMIRSEILKANLDYLQSKGPFLFNDEFFKKLKNNKQEIVTWPFSRVVYAGEMEPSAKITEYFNPNLAVSKTEFSTVEALQVSRNYKDE
jgi:O-antigen biosynthesis protein